ncbi:MAG: DUF3228 family protein [Myxococcota bacterium]
MFRPGKPSLGWSQFALDRHLDPETQRRWLGSPEALLDLVAAHWTERQPGKGRADRSQVVVVPVPAEGFVGSTVAIDERTPLRAEWHQRAEGEECVLRVRAGGEAEPARFAQIVLYSAETLLENGGRRSTEADWEVVALLAGGRPDEPMDPVTMARNFLERPGGTFAPYTAEAFAEAIWYWARHAVRDGSS